MSATIGAIGVFLIARTSVGDSLLAQAGRRIQSLAAGFRADAFAYLLFLRFLPVVPFWITNLASALFGVPLKTFALGTMIGVIPATYTFAVTGAGLDSIIRAQREAHEACLSAQRNDCVLDFSLSSLVTPQLVGAFVALGVLALAPVLVKRFYGSRLERLGRKAGRV
jgi:uncharacterized membrane protein YdjX (TVP38/TMEM64 family)